MKKVKYICSNCNSEINDSDKFCTSCGKELKPVVDTIDDAAGDWMATSADKSGKGKNVIYNIKGLDKKDPKKEEIGNAFYKILVKAIDIVSKKYAIPVERIDVKIKKV